jgi:hypothetical protein
MSSRSLRVARVVLLVAVVGWFFSPPDWRYAIPLWLPFVVAAGLELEFAVTGWRQRDRRPPRSRRAPQPADLERFGWPAEPPDEDDPAFWSSPPVPRVRSSVLRRILTSLVVVGFVALAVWAVSVRRGWSALDEATQTRVEHVLSREAARIAGHAATVVCDTGGRHVGAVQEADGLAEVGGRRAWLTPGICFRLYGVIDGRSDRHPSYQTGHAIAVLAHESWHLHGVADEGLANCFAFQSGVGIGERLGLSASLARSLMREQLADNAADAASPAYLVPAGCENGGRFDLHPHSERFP